MADKQASERSVGPSDVELISVTVTALPSDRGSLRERLPGVGVPRWAGRLLAAGAAFAGLAIVLIALSSQGRQLARADRADPRGARSGSAPATVAFPYPTRCMSVAISDINPRYVAAVERANGCAGSSQYVTASFHRMDGGWRLVLGQRPPAGWRVVGAARRSLRCLRLAVVLHDPMFMGPERASCTHGRLAWLVTEPAISRVTSGNRRRSPPA